MTITVLGTVATPLLRSSVAAGDTLYVTGALGASAAALRALLGGRQPSPAHRARFARPVPRLTEARWLAGNGATAGIDVSDGLLAELGHLAAASGVRISLDDSAVPVAAGASLDDALEGGEEYELVVAGRRIDVAAFEAAHGLTLTAIGIALTVEPGALPGVDVSARVGRRGGHDHLSG